MNTNVIGNTFQELTKEIPSVKRKSTFYWNFTLCVFYKVLPKVYMIKFCSIGPGRTRANFVYFQFLASKKLAKISQVPNFGGGRIGRSCFNQNFADRHIRHKIYRLEKGACVNCALDFMQEYKSLQIFLGMFSTLRSPSLRLACWRLCCLHNL